MEPRAFGSSPEEHDALDEAALARRITPSDDGFVIGVFDGDALVGTAGVRREDGRKSRHKAFVWGVYVTPRARGRGLGRRAMERAIERARTLSGVERLNLTVTHDDSAARRLYLALGFTVYGTERAALKLDDGTTIDEDLMALAL